MPHEMLLVSTLLGTRRAVYDNWYSKLRGTLRVIIFSPFANCLYKTVSKYIIIINDTLARSLEPVVTECKEHTIHTQTQIVASRKPKEIKHTHEGEANFT